MDNPSGFEIYDHYLHTPLKQAGWNHHTLSWRQQEDDWSSFDVVIIRSTWDYQDHYNEFIATLTKINESSALLLNNLDIVKWNLDKIYLQELNKSGYKIVPSLWPESFNKSYFSSAYELFKTDKIIIKPRVSANADNTFIVKYSDLDIDSNFNLLQRIYKNRPFVIQPFMQNILHEGEYSLFYFGGKFSHAILKTPKQGDFRVQEEHGGKLQAITPEVKLLSAGEAINEYFNKSLLYARYDFVRDNNDFYIMEAELIEPSLYFNLAPNAADNFVRALDNI